MGMFEYMDVHPIMSMAYYVLTWIGILLLAYILTPWEPSSKEEDNAGKKES